jgi:sulfopyruvate decarboxylase TPP-binding subunit
MGPKIIGAIHAEVTSKLWGIPFIGSLLAGLINTVIGTFTPVVSLVVGAFGALINAVPSLLDLLKVSIPFTLLKFDKQQTFIPANVPLGGDAPVNLTLAALTANVLDRELVAEGQLA